MYWDAAARRSAPTVLRDLVSLLISDTILIRSGELDSRTCVQLASKPVICLKRKLGAKALGGAKADRAGAVAQLGERLICTQEVVGSIPISSTSMLGL